MSRITRTMDAANKPSYALIAVLSFGLLAAYSYQNRPVEYASRAEFNAPLDKASDKKPKTTARDAAWWEEQNAEKMVNLYGSNGERL